MNEDPIPINGCDATFDFEVDAYYKLIRLNNRDVDERVSAIELQMAKSVKVQGVIDGVILPAAYVDRPGVWQQIEGWGATCIPYNIGETFRPNELHGVIVDKLREFLRFSKS